MRQRIREEGAWSVGINPGAQAAYSVIEWEDETGDADVYEYAPEGDLLRQFAWVRQVAEKRVLVVELKPAGVEVGRRYIAEPESTRGW